MKKAVLIVGASSGIGLATAELFVKRGDRVFNASRGKCPLKSVTNLECDVSSEDTLTQAIDSVVLECGRLDALVYSAGFSMAAPLEYSEQSDVRYLFEVNFFGFLRAVQHVLPQMKKQGGGTIVAVSSIGGVLPIAFDACYSASKSALNALVAELQLELEDYKIGVYSVMPGGTKTGFTQKRKVYSAEKCGYYAENLEKAVKSLANTEQGGMKPSRVAKTIVRVTNGTANYLVSAGLRNKLLHALSRMLPLRWISRMLSIKYF